MGAQQGKERGYGGSAAAYQHSLSGLKSLKNKSRSTSRDARFVTASGTLAGTNVFAEHNGKLLG
jgi:mevalonate pyrophosphate decarboxylase